MLSGGSHKFTLDRMGYSQMTEVMTTFAAIAVTGGSHGRIILWND